MDILTDILVVVAAFTGGAFVGAHNVQTVDNAIAKIRQAEAGAKATLAKITAHKAN